jgi:ribosomal protein S18 acetylase RimI-like enzyme
LLVWPDRLERGGIEWLRAWAPLGLRVVVFGELADCPIWPGVVSPTRLRIYRARAGAARGEDIGDSLRIPAELAPALQDLSRACGLTPLPAALFRGGAGWWHRWLRCDGSVVAGASGQVLDRPIAGWREPTGLVCGVAVLPQLRRHGFGRRMVDGLRAGAPVGRLAALVVADDAPSNRFFAAAGWDDSGNIAETAQWA